MRFAPTSRTRSGCQRGWLLGQLGRQSVGNVGCVPFPINLTRASYLAGGGCGIYIVLKFNSSRREQSTATVEKAVQNAERINILGCF
jgi:hypothetical protein